MGVFLRGVSDEKGFRLAGQIVRNGTYLAREYHHFVTAIFLQCFDDGAAETIRSSCDRDDGGHCEFGMRDKRLLLLTGILEVVFEC